VRKQTGQSHRQRHGGGGSVTRRIVTCAYADDHARTMTQWSLFQAFKEEGWRETGMAGVGGGSEDGGGGGRWWRRRRRWRGRGKGRGKQAKQGDVCATRRETSGPSVLSEISHPSASATIPVCVCVCVCVCMCVCVCARACTSLCHKSLCRVYACVCGTTYIQKRAFAHAREEETVEGEATRTALLQQV